LVTRASAAQTPELRPDSRMVYVSSSLGSDTNDGLTPATPKKTLAAAAALLRDGHPDWLLLRRGDEWTEGLGGLDLGGRSAGEPMVITTFGLGSEPAKITPADGGDALPFGEHVLTLNISFPDSGPQGAVGIGWTEFTPSADTRVIYVSSSEGNDSTGVVYNLLNADHADLIGSDPMDPVGTVRSFRTLSAAVGQLRNGSPDWVLLKRGDVWTNETLGTWTKSGRGFGEMMVFGAYGDVSEERPRVLTGNSTFVSSFDPVRHVAFVSFAIEPHTRTPADVPTGFRWLGESSENILLEDLSITGYANNLTLQANDLQPIGLFRIRRCLVADAWSTQGHAQGIFARDVNQLVIEECVFDRNGWNPDVAGAVATIFNRNMYIKDCPDAVTRGNIDARGASGGIQQRVGGLCEFNLSLKNALGITFGHAENHADMPARGVIRYNVLLDANDVGTRARGMGIGVGEYSDGVLVHDNIIAHNRSGTGTVRAIQLTTPDAAQFCRNVTVRENIVYSWYEPDEGGSWGFAGTAIHVRDTVSDVVVEDNIFQQVLSGGEVFEVLGYMQPSWSFARNTYASANRVDQQFDTREGRVCFDDWVGLSNEVEAVNGVVDFPDPMRTIETYAASKGLDASLDAFLAEARQQRRGEWRDEFSAYSVINYIREGFGEEPVSP
jgi:hypothetical protein